MANKIKRIMITFPPDIENELMKLKKEEFFNSPYTKMIQYVVALGLEAHKNKRKISS